MNATSCESDVPSLLLLWLWRLRRYLSQLRIPSPSVTIYSLQHWKIEFNQLTRTQIVTTVIETHLLLFHFQCSYCSCLDFFCHLKPLSMKYENVNQVIRRVEILHRKTRRICRDILEQTAETHLGLFFLDSIRFPLRIFLRILFQFLCQQFQLWTIILHGKQYVLMWQTYIGSVRNLLVFRFDSCLFFSPIYLCLLLQYPIRWQCLCVNVFFRWIKTSCTRILLP